MTPEIFLIHDSKRTDRRELFRKEFDTQGIDMYTLVPANKDTSRPVINISRAHKDCIRRAIARDLDKVVIMEDDVKFSCPGSYNRFLELSGMFPAEIATVNWDVFISGSYEYQFSHDHYKDGPLVPLKRFSGLHCYMVHSRYYQSFLSLGENLNIDKQIGHSKANIWMAYPMLALQYDGFSDNVKRETRYNTTYAKKINLWNCKLE